MKFKYLQIRQHSRNRGTGWGRERKIKRVKIYTFTNSPWWMYSLYITNTLRKNLNPDERRQEIWSGSKNRVGLYEAN